MHYYWSELPAYILKCYATAKRKYNCKECVDEKYENNDWEAKSNTIIQEQFLTKEIKRKTEKQAMGGSNERENEDRLSVKPVVRGNKK